MQEKNAFKFMHGRESVIVALFDIICTKQIPLFSPSCYSLIALHRVAYEISLCDIKSLIFTNINYVSKGKWL